MEDKELRKKINTIREAQTIIIICINDIYNSNTKIEDKKLREKLNKIRKAQSEITQTINDIY